jgi:hypothetical protein
MDKAGIGIAISITAITLAVGIGSVSMFEFENPFMQQEPTTPTIQEKPAAPTIQEKPIIPYLQMKSSSSYAPSDGNLIDQLDWSISTGDVSGMYLDKSSSSLIIHTSTIDDGELFVGLIPDYIGSDDGTFFIIVDNQEHEDFEQAGMDLYISIPAGTQSVEIIGSYTLS